MNRTTTFALGATTGSLLIATASMAGFTGGSIVEDFVGTGWNENGFGAAGLRVFRLYATFDGLGDDGVLAVFGQPGDPIVVSSSDGEFHNDPLGGLTAPVDLTGVGIWSNQWDTYVTIGVTSSAGDATGLSPGFATVSNNLGSNWESDNAGWFVTPDDAQSIGTNILIAQLVVREDEGLADIRVNILTRENETFMIHPAPGTLAFLALAGVRTSRCRRRS